MASSSTNNVREVNCLTATLAATNLNEPFDKSAFKAQLSSMGKKELNGLKLENYSRPQRRLIDEERVRRRRQEQNGAQQNSTLNPAGTDGTSGRLAAAVTPQQTPTTAAAGLHNVPNAIPAAPVATAQDIPPAAVPNPASSARKGKKKEKGKKPVDRQTLGTASGAVVHSPSATLATSSVAQTSTRNSIAAQSQSRSRSNDVNQVTTGQATVQFDAGNLDFDSYIQSLRPRTTGPGPSRSNGKTSVPNDTARVFGISPPPQLSAQAPPSVGASGSSRSGGARKHRKRSDPSTERTAEPNSDMGGPTETVPSSYFPFGAYHDLILEQVPGVTFRNAINTSETELWRTKTFAKFKCSKKKCKNTWVSGLVVMHIRGYETSRGWVYNVMMYNQRCLECNSLGIVTPDKDSFVMRVVRRLRCWMGLPVEALDHDFTEKESTGEHEYELCEACKAGECEWANLYGLTMASRSGVGRRPAALGRVYR